MASEDLPANGHGGPADPRLTLGKRDLRRSMRAARAAYVAELAAGERERLEAALAARIGSMCPAGVVAGYAAVGSEVRLAGLRFAYPRVTPDGLSFHFCPADQLSRSASGIPEPSADRPLADPDVLLIPVLAVDYAGNRLGQGAGYYDRALAALRRARPRVAIGVAWDLQLVDTLPTDEWDAPLDGLATPTRWLSFAATRPELATAARPSMSER